VLVSDRSYAGEIESTPSGRIVGASRALRQVMQQVEAVASTDATVLITGESGTGKELLAKEVHRRGRRSERPFVKVNCGAIPREIFERSPLRPRRRGRTAWHQSHDSGVALARPQDHAAEAALIAQRPLFVERSVHQQVDA
jgi:transcriptional regulator of aromatic amino acid metabolism